MSRKKKHTEVKELPKTKKSYYDYIIYTDGSGNNMDKKLGTSAYIILDGFESNIIKKAANHYSNVTNNQMELNGIIEAVSELPPNSSCLIFTDSQYCINVLDHRTKDFPKNMEYIEEFRFQVDDKNIKYAFKWVKGHNGNKWNEIVDKMANDLFVKMGGEDYKQTVKRIWKAPVVKSKKEEICDFVETLSCDDIEFLKELLNNKY